MRATPPAFDDHVRRTGWLYARSVEYDGRAYVHVPLLYSTRIGPELEAYARALTRFPQLLGVPFACDVQHDVVAVFSDPAALSELWFRDVARCEAAARAAALGVAGRFPSQVLAAEAAPSASSLRSAHATLVEAIAVNLANPFVELHRPPVRVAFSADRWFHERAKTLPVTWDAIVDFAWEGGFLPRRAAERAVWMDPPKLADQLGYRGPRPERRPIIRRPAIDAPDSADLLVLLGEMEEFRHYWQARLARLFETLARRLHIDRESTLDDYCARL